MELEYFFLTQAMKIACETAISVGSRCVENQTWPIAQACVESVLEYHNQINNDVVNAQLTCVEIVCDSLLNVDVLTSVCRQSIGEPQKSNEHVIVSTPEATV